MQLNDNIIKNTIAEVENSLNLATITFKKQENLWKQKIGSEIQYLQAKTQKESLEKKLKTLNSQLALTQIRAPFSGYVDNITLKEGELASPGIRVLELVNLRKMLIKADNDKTETVPVDIRCPIAIEPYGSVTQHGRAYRPSKNDLYSLMKDWVHDKDIEIEQQQYVVANLIRGGVFGGSGE